MVNRHGEGQVDMCYADGLGAVKNDVRLRPMKAQVWFW